jgi:hypothetical protein
MIRSQRAPRWCRVAFADDRLAPQDLLIPQHLLAGDDVVGRESLRVPRRIVLPPRHTREEPDQARRVDGARPLRQDVLAGDIDGGELQHGFRRKGRQLALVVPVQ